MAREQRKAQGRRQESKEGKKGSQQQGKQQQKGRKGKHHQEGRKENPQDSVDELGLNVSAEVLPKPQKRPRKTKCRGGSSAQALAPDEERRGILSTAASKKAATCAEGPEVANRRRLRIRRLEVAVPLRELQQD